MPHLTHPRAIQNYNLFGESGDFPDVVHCESIATRSTLHNWEFSPHRHAQLHQVLLIENGGGTARIEGERYTLAPNSIVNVPVGLVHGFSFHPQTSGLVVTMGEEIIDETLSALEGVRQVFNQYGMFTSSIEIRQIFKNIAREHIHMDFARAHILRALSGQLIGQIARLISTQFGPSDTMPNTLLNRKFEALLDAKFQFQWSVAQYATALAVTPGHLSRVMRDATGLSASKIIDARIVREAKRNLTYTSLTISEIAYDLGYIDPAYFSRVFTRTAGISPRQFRQNLLKRS